MKRKRLSGFTLAEVLITLAIIGVVAALSIPAVISNSQQQEFKTGLRKAVSVLNSAITMNMALDGESPYDNANLFGYLQKHMAVLKSTNALPYRFSIETLSTQSIGGTNAAFYTTDGMRFEMDDVCGGAGCITNLLLHESGVATCKATLSGDCGGCGSYGLNNNPDNTTKPPCLIMVDVNGDKKPNPNNINCKENSCMKTLKYPEPNSVLVMDIFTIMITDKNAIPFGTVAQKAMYQARK